MFLNSILSNSSDFHNFYSDFFEKHLLFELALLVLLRPDADRVLAFHCKDILHQ